MPNKMPYIQWYPADWIAATTMLSPAARGIWFDILNAMWLLDRAEKISGTLAELARAGRCDAAQMQTAVDELTRFRVANVTERNGIITLVCRRFQKANAERVRVREAVKKSRSNGNVTEMLRRNITEDRIQNTEFTHTSPLPAIPDESAESADGGDDVGEILQNCKVYRGFPRNAVEVMEIADRSGVICTDEMAEAYLLNRQATGWIKAGNRPVRNVPADVKSWCMNWRQNHADDEKRRSGGGAPVIDRAGREARKKRAAELEKAAQNWEARK